MTPLAARACDESSTIASDLPMICSDTSHLVLRSNAHGPRPRSSSPVDATCSPAAWSAGGVPQRCFVDPARGGRDRGRAAAGSTGLRAAGWDPGVPLCWRRAPDGLLRPADPSERRDDRAALPRLRCDGAVDHLLRLAAD